MNAALEVITAARDQMRDVWRMDPSNVAMRPEILTSMRTLGRLQGKLGETAEAERNLSSAFDLSRRLASDAAEDQAAMAVVNDTLADLSKLLLRPGQPADAAAQAAGQVDKDHQQAIGSFAEIARKNPRAAAPHLALVDARLNYAAFLASEGRANEAADQARQAAEVAGRWAEAEPTDPAVMKRAEKAREAVERLPATRPATKPAP